VNNLENGDIVKVEDWDNPSEILGFGIVVHPDTQPGSNEHHGGSHRYRVLFRERLTWFYNYELVKV